MVKINPILLTDSYKLTHHKMYPNDTTHFYSYFEPRSGGKHPSVVFFGLSYFIQEYLLNRRITIEDVEEAKDLCAAHFGRSDIFDEETWTRVVKENNGIYPIKIWSIPEGAVLTSSNVFFAMQLERPYEQLSTHLETLLSNVWAPSTVATNSYYSSLLFKMLAKETASEEFITDFQEHDFGARGVTSPESAAICGAGHLLSFKGTDTLAAIKLLHDYYGAPWGSIAYSVPASEHSVMTSRGESGESRVFEHLLDTFPSGILSVVIDSYNWKRFVNQYSEMFKEKILKRNGVLVYRPDSGDPVVITLACLKYLSEIFGYTTNKKGFKVLNPKVRVLWGDGLDSTKTYSLLSQLQMYKWSSENLVTGKGGGLLQKINRDDQRFALKLSQRGFIENGIQSSIDIMKNPIDSSKKSKSGRFHVIKDGLFFKTVKESEETESKNILKLVYDNGEHLYKPTLEEARNNLKLFHNSQIVNPSLEITL